MSQGVPIAARRRLSESKWISGISTLSVSTDDTWLVALLTELIPLVYPFAMIGHWLIVDRPAFRYLGCPRAERAGFVVLLVAALGGWASFTVVGLRLGMTPASWTWVLLVAAWWVLIIWGNPGYVVLRRLAGGEDVRPALRNILWSLGLELPHVARPDADPAWTKKVQYSIEWLGWLRTPDTDAIIDLWLAEVEAVQSGRWDRKTAVERHGAIQAEARRLWPDGDEWKVAALAG